MSIYQRIYIYENIYVFICIPIYIYIQLVFIVYTMTRIIFLEMCSFFVIPNFLVGKRYVPQNKIIYLRICNIRHLHKFRRRKKTRMKKKH